MVQQPMITIEGILARSRGQKVRGLRHLQFRPRLVIVDDPEDGEWVRTKENRDKIAAIRTAWKQKTGDQSVLQVTEPADVSF